MSSKPHDTSLVSLHRYEYSTTVCCIDLSSDGALLAAGQDNGAVTVRGLSDGADAESRVFRDGGGSGARWWISEVKFSPNGEWLAACSMFWPGLAVWMWNVETGAEVVLPTPPPGGGVKCIAFLPTSDGLAYGRSDRNVEVIPLDGGEPPISRNLPIDFPDSVDAMAFSPDGTKLATGSTNREVCVWNLADGRLIHKLPPHTGAVSLAFSPDGDLLLSGSTDKRVRVWHVERGSMLEEERLSGLGVRAVAWGPGGNFWAARSPGSPGVVRLWDWRRRQVVHDFPQISTQTDQVWPTRALAVSLGGELLVTYTPANLQQLEVWDISAVSERRRAAAGARVSLEPFKEPVRLHLATLPLAHTRPPTPSRPALWLRSAASVGASLPLFLAQDLGTLLARPDAQKTLSRPDHLPAEMNTSDYLAFLQRVAAQPLLRDVSGWDVSDAMIGVVLARLVAGVEFPTEYALPGGRELVECVRMLGKELDRLDPARVWGGDKAPGGRPSIGALLPPEAFERIEVNLRGLGRDELRFLHQYGPRFSGAPDPRSLLDLFSLLNMPPAVRLALSQVLRLLPRVSQSAKAGSTQTYSLGGYSGLTRKGNLDNLVLTELAHSQPMFLHRMMNREALYYGREAEQERRRELAYIVTQAGLELLGDGEVVARALTLALAQTMARRGYVVQQSFVGSTWTPPALMSEPSDVQRVLYYRDGGWLRAREMLSAVSERLRVDAERYRSMHVLWVVSEFWDADQWGENEKLYAALRQRGEQQVWVVRVGGARAERRRDCSPAVRQLGRRCHVINSNVLWLEHSPPERTEAPEPAKERPGVLRFDGLYQARGDMRFYWYYLKFYETGGVWYIASNEPPDKVVKTIPPDPSVEKILLDNLTGVGTFAIGVAHPNEVSSHLSFSMTTLSGVLDYDGTISGDLLKLKWANKGNGREGAEEYRFIRLPVDEMEAGHPAPEDGGGVRA